MTLSEIDFLRICAYRSHVFKIKTRQIIETDYGKILNLYFKKDKESKRKLKKLMEKISIKFKPM